MIDPLTLPDDLPVPVDDGAADHLPGAALPELRLTATDGAAVSLADLPGRTLIYAYPWTARPGEPLLVADWDLIPGARGCTPKAAVFVTITPSCAGRARWSSGSRPSRPTTSASSASASSCRSRSSPMPTWRWRVRCACRRSRPAVTR